MLSTVQSRAKIIFLPFAKQIKIFAEDWIWPPFDSIALRGKLLANKAGNYGGTAVGTENILQYISQYNILCTMQHGHIFCSDREQQKMLMGAVRALAETCSTILRLLTLVSYTGIQPLKATARITWKMLDSVMNIPTRPSEIKIYVLLLDLVQYDADQTILIIRSTPCKESPNFDQLFRWIPCALILRLVAPGKTCGQGVLV